MKQKKDDEIDEPFCSKFGIGVFPIDTSGS
jgi:hypothetical protein